MAFNDGMTTTELLEWFVERERENAAYQEQERIRHNERIDKLSKKITMLTEDLLLADKKIAQLEAKKSDGDHTDQSEIAAASQG